MDIAIHKAKKIGCGWVTARGTYYIKANYVRVL